MEAVWVDTGCVLLQALLATCCAVCAQELAEGDSLEEITLMDGATFHNLARQCRLDPGWHEQVTRFHSLYLLEQAGTLSEIGHETYLTSSE